MNLVVAVGAMVILMAIAVAAELLFAAFTRLGRARAHALDEARPNSRSPLGELVAHRDVVLGPAQLIRIATLVTVTTIVAVLVHDRWGIAWLVLAVVAEIVVLFVIVAVPLVAGYEATDRVAKTMGRPAARLGASVGVLTRPVIRLARRFVPKAAEPEAPEIAEDELLAVAEAAAREAAIEDEERWLIESIIELGDTVTREVMVPRPDMSTLTIDATVADAIEVVLGTGYTRIPVCGDSVDDIVGLVLSKDMLRAHVDGRTDATIGSWLRPAAFVPETKGVAELMREMQTTKSHMAIVVDEYGGTAGLITLEDIIEELVGEIVDEYDDEAPLYESLGDGEWRVKARMPLDELGELIGSELPDGDWDTVGGLVFSLLGHVPDAGEWVDCDGHRLFAERIDGRRIEVVRVAPMPG